MDTVVYVNLTTSILSKTPVSFTDLLIELKVTNTGAR